MKNPCEKTCPERTGTCHADCGKYALYAEACEKKRNERIRANRDKYVSERAKQYERDNLRKGRKTK